MIYYVEPDSVFSSVARQVLAAIRNGEIVAVASTILLSELTVLPYRQRRHNLAARYETTLVTFPNLDVLSSATRTPLSPMTAACSSSVTCRSCC